MLLNPFCISIKELQQGHIITLRLVLPPHIEHVYSPFSPGPFQYPLDSFLFFSISFLINCLIYPLLLSTLSSFSMISSSVFKFNLIYTLVVLLESYVSKNLFFFLNKYYRFPTFQPYNDTVRNYFLYLINIHMCRWAIVRYFGRLQYIISVNTYTALIEIHLKIKRPRLFGRGLRITLFTRILQFYSSFVLYIVQT